MPRAAGRLRHRCQYSAVLCLSRRGARRRRGGRRVVAGRRPRRLLAEGCRYKSARRPARAQAVRHPPVADRGVRNSPA